MLSLLLACTTTLAFAAEADAAIPTSPPTVQVRTIAWSVFGVDQSVRVLSDDDKPWELALESEPKTWLRSIVGPMFSTVQISEASDGTPEVAQIITRIDDDAPFDLIQWIDTSDQSGAALAQLLTNPRCTMEGQCDETSLAWPDHPHCPSAESIAAWDGGILELSRMLVATECFTDAQIGIQPEAFWIDDWQDGQVTLAVQREHCLGDEGACRGEVSFVKLTPPASWRPWLEEAYAHRGHLSRLAPPPAKKEAPASKPQPEQVDALPSVASL